MPNSDGPVKQDAGCRCEAESFMLWVLDTTISCIGGLAC
jgi:hypothetical protein